MNYTKGEWRQWSSMNGHHIWCNNTHIADVDSGKADAQLIASAPDLYEACKEVAKAYKCSPTSMQPLFWLRCVQALAKAEGK